MAITRAQQAKQMLQSGGEVLGPLGENNLTNQLSPGTVSKVVPNIGRGLAFILSGGLSGGVSAVAEELAKQKILDEAAKKAGNVIRPRLLTQVMQEDNRVRGIGGYQSDFAQDSDFMGGKGTAAEMGSFADGGNVVGGEFDFESARQMYGLGKLVKKVTRTVKKIAKSPVGKAALLYVGAGGLGNIAAGKSFFGGSFANVLRPTQFLGNVGSIFSKGGLENIMSKARLGKFVTSYGDQAPVFEKNILGKALTSPGGIIAATSLLPLLGLGTGEETEEEAEELIRGSGLDINAIRANPNQFLARRFRAEGGSMKEPVAKKTMPLLDLDGKEMDLRAEGGFVPIGRMEKADDVPARLSKNEFVFTADAVRNAGDGDVDKGAEVMYNMMKNLESGGDVSKESQGLQGARKMFQTSKRLEEVL
jgi:hypothetical protein